MDKNDRVELNAKRDKNIKRSCEYHPFECPNEGREVTIYLVPIDGEICPKIKETYYECFRTEGKNPKLYRREMGTSTYGMEGLNYESHTGPTDRVTVSFYRNNHVREIEVNCNSIDTRPYKMIPFEKGAESKFILVLKRSKGGDIRAEMLNIPARKVAVAPMARGPSPAQSPNIKFALYKLYGPKYEYTGEFTKRHFFRDLTGSEEQPETLKKRIEYDEWPATTAPIPNLTLEEAMAQELEISSEVESYRSQRGPPKPLMVRAAPKPPAEPHMGSDEEEREKNEILRNLSNKTWSERDSVS